jgi:predicted TIM-barrel enzyme
MLQHASAVVVGSSIKRDGDWRQGPDPKRCKAILKAAGL